MPTVLRRSCIPGPALAVLLYAGCSQAPTLEPTYEACATDENWINFDDYEKTGRVTTSGTQVPVWTAPAMGAAIAASAAPTFQWQPSASNAGTPDGDATCPQYQPASLPGGLSSGLNSGLHAGLHIEHLPPVSGTVYDLHLSIDGSDVYRVVTTRQRAGIAQATWAGFGGKSVIATLYEAKMLVNSIVEGPYQAAALTVQVTQ